MDFKRNDLFTPEDFHGNGGAGLEFRQARHIFIDVTDRFAVDLLDDVAALHSGLMGGFPRHHDVGTETGNGAGSRDVGHQAQRHQ